MLSVVITFATCTHAEHTFECCVVSAGELVSGEGKVVVSRAVTPRSSGVAEALLSRGNMIVVGGKC